MISIVIKKKFDIPKSILTNKENQGDNSHTTTLQSDLTMLNVMNKGHSFTVPPGEMIHTGIF